MRADELDRYSDEKERVYDTDENATQAVAQASPRDRSSTGCGDGIARSRPAITLQSRSHDVLYDIALRELISNSTTADEVLDLTICEPAMGSAAFLNEAVNQLGRAVPGTQAEGTGRTDPP